MTLRLLPVAVVLAFVTLASGCGSDDGDVEAFCQQAKAAGDLDRVFDDFDTTDVEGTAAQFDEAVAFYEGLRGDAPPEVRGDLDVLIDFTSDFRDSLRAADPADSSGTTAAALDLEARFADVEEATVSLDAFLANGCPVPGA